MAAKHVLITELIICWYKLLKWPTRDQFILFHQYEQKTHLCSLQRRPNVYC